MSVILTGIGLIILTGLISLFIRDAKSSTRFGAVGVILGSVISIVPAIKVLCSGNAISLKVPWQVPYGSFYVELDSISALFLIPVLLICSIAAVYGCGYMLAYKNRRLGIPTFFFNILAASMAMVVMARNSILFLAAWEVMSLTSYFLVTFDDEHESVRQAGWIYLVATHIGTAFLLAFFIVLGKYSGSLDFDSSSMLKTIAPAASSGLFLLALVGFGTKAGIMPLHVWLPEAHPAAPSHVSAVMSGVMIKMGIYGIIRTLSILPNIELWWGWLLIGLGIVSGLLGILFALAQHDIKRMLAYSSVENIGIILIGLGQGLVGIASGLEILVVFGFAGALLHIINHSIFKSLLFMGAGSILHSTGTRYMDLLGGLIKRMPQTAAAFVIGAIAICGLPPLNGFIGEFLLYYGSFSAALSDGVRLVVPTAGAIAALAVIGGFALAAFTKVFGIVFLGQPRTSQAANAHKANAEMQIAMWIAAGLCVIIGLAAPLILPAIIPVISQIAPVVSETTAAYISQANKMLLTIVAASIVFMILAAVLVMFRYRLLRNKTAAQSPTWDCGYAAPTPRMQYTSSSFSQPIVDMFKSVLYSRSKTVKIKELFPEQAQFESHTPDVSSEYLYRPIFERVDWVISKMRWVQYGVVQMYVLYIAITLIILLVWKLK
ncbi:MAG: proton-conducting transporter membrane subunit [Phycisphaerae bacterium]|jgi:formate hydrogenlyase subunit 3/multisubunit Na+/H+ antiporter MnhD subunit